MEYIYAGCEATSVYIGKVMETADIVGHQHYWSDGTLGGVRSLDIVETLPPIQSSSTGAATMDSGGYFDSSPSVFQLPELEAAKDDEFEGGDGWMEWLAKEAGWSWGLNECCESSESSGMTGSALYCTSSPAEDEIINLFFRCVKFVEEEESEKAAEAVAELRRRCSPLGDPTERVLSYFTLALSEAAPEKFEAAEVAAAHGALNDACPYLNFAYLTANQAILDGAASAERIHIVDFGIRQGVQWAALLQALATRPQGKPRKIKITGLPSPSEPDSSSLSATGIRLTEFAAFLDLELEFSSLLADVDDSTLAHDYVAVNFMFHLSGLANVAAVMSALKLVESMKPNVITLAEYELSWQRCAASGGGGFLNAFEYFLAVFESVESQMGRDCGERARVERVLFGEEIKRAVDLGRNCGGCMRTMEEWHSIMEKGGFKRFGASHYAMSQARILLDNYSNKYSLMESAGAVSLCWQNRPLVTVSLWTPLETDA